MSATSFVFYRKLFFSAFLVIFSTIFNLVASNQYSVNGAQDSGSNIGFEWISTHSVLHDSLESVCPPSNKLCFGSKQNAAAVNEGVPESEAPDHSLMAGGFPSELKEIQCKPNFLTHHGTYRFLGGKTVSCCVHQQDDFSEVSSSESTGIHEISHQVLQLRKRLHSPNSSNDRMRVKLGFTDGSSPVPLEINPSVMDWGERNLYSSSLAFLTVKNVDADNIFRIYDLYSSSMQFYSCNFSELLLVPGEVASLCFVFSPSHAGLASGQLVLQTSFGGLLIQAKGFGVESPYLKYPTRGLSSIGRSRKELSLFNPFDEVLHIREVTAWISTSSEFNSNSSMSIFHIENIQNPIECDVLNANDWVVVERMDQTKVALRMPKNWEVAPHDTQPIIELDISGQGKAVGALSMKFSRPLNHVMDTLILPFELELIHNSSVDISSVSSSLVDLVPCFISLSVRNEALDIISVSKVNHVGENVGIFEISYVEGLIIFPRTVTQVAILSYKAVATPKSNMECNVTVLFNDTRKSQIKIPCRDIVNVCSRFQSNSSVGFTTEFFISSYINNADRPLSGIIQLQDVIKEVNYGQVDEMAPGNVKTHGAVGFTSVLDKAELLFPKVLVGKYSSRWINVTNPSQEPVVMQLILNPEEVYFNCRRIEMSLQPYLSLVGDKTGASAKYGFSVSKNALTEAVVHPFSSAALGPILFRPSERCEWRSSALVRNNLSGVERISLQGYGFSLSLLFLEGGNLVQSLQFQFNLNSQLCTSSLDLYVGSESCLCSQLLNKEVHIKNMGDLSLEVKQIHVSGAKCGLDGFMIKNCSGFSLQPGESASLHILYKPDFSAPTIKRDLELVLTNGILFIPMKVNAPLRMLSFCKSWLFWIRVRNVMRVLLLFAFFLSMVMLLLFSQRTFSASDDHRGRKISLKICPKWKNFCAKLTSHMGHEVIAQELSLLSRSSSSSEYEKQLNRILDAEPETGVASEVISRTSSIEDLDVHAELESHLRVRVKGEKARGRKKKKSPGPAWLSHEFSSSQSGNSTPSSPLSPISFTRMKRSLPVSPSIRPALLQYDKDMCSSSTCSSITKEKNSSSDTTSSLVKTVIRKPCLLPSATWPGSFQTASSSWTCDSPDLTSTSKIPPHARAPGTKAANQDDTMVDEKMIFDQKYTFDIWGDHPYSPISPLDISANGENSSESFFIRSPIGPSSSTPTDV